MWKQKQKILDHGTDYSVVMDILKQTLTPTSPTKKSRSMNNVSDNKMWYTVTFGC